MSEDAGHRTAPLVPNVITTRGDQPARAGYDHSWFEWSPFPARPPVEWPGGRRTAVSIVVHLGAAEWEQAGDPAPRPPGGRGIGGPPDVPRLSHREFGHRVGIFRLLRILGASSIAPAVALDVLSAESYRGLLDQVLPVASEVLAAGLSASRPITTLMSEAEERDYIAVSLERLAAALGHRPAGWIGPEHSESRRTPALLAEAGVRYVADWANDDVPYRFAGVSPELWGFPLSWELSDVAAAFLRMVSPDTWADSAVEAFDVLHAEGGRVFSLHLHPWLSGQAYRAAALERVLAHIGEADGVWIASPGEVVEHCRGQVSP